MVRQRHLRDCRGRRCGRGSPRTAAPPCLSCPGARTHPGERGRAQPGADRRAGAHHVDGRRRGAGVGRVRGAHRGARAHALLDALWRPQPSVERVPAGARLAAPGASARSPRAGAEAPRTVLWLDALPSCRLRRCRCRASSSTTLGACSPSTTRPRRAGATAWRWPARWASPHASWSRRSGEAEIEAPCAPRSWHVHTGRPLNSVVAGCTSSARAGWCSACGTRRRTARRGARRRLRTRTRCRRPWTWRRGCRAWRTWCWSSSTTTSHRRRAREEREEQLGRSPPLWGPRRCRSRRARSCWRAWPSCSGWRPRCCSWEATEPRLRGRDA